ncbi:MAG: competence/damage-inducible protein A [Alphaproteobacteria bacterium]|jgi:nicotinamide-nucleotide amidase
MRIEIICTGDEILSGKTINTNFAHISRRLQETGLPVTWETTVGDDKEELIRAFKLAGERADVVIVNGGLGPTQDDLSTPIAAETAGVGLELHEAWLAKIEGFYAQRGRVMPPNNRKQAMLPVGAEFIDNPVGTACGFAITIGKGRFFFTPGVPRELKVMLEDQLIPRLQGLSGKESVVYLKRFHSFGLGESRVDALLQGVEELAPAGAVKMGFQAHYPQLETKLMVEAATMEEAKALVAPVAAEVAKRMGNFILCEDTATLEGTILNDLAAIGGSIAVAEVGTFGGVGTRLARADEGRGIFQRSAVCGRAVDLVHSLDLSSMDELAASAAAKVRQQTGTTHGLAVVIEPSEGSTQQPFTIAVATASEVITRTSALVGDANRVRIGGTEMTLDTLRRLLEGKPTQESMDFERVG